VNILVALEKKMASRKTAGRDQHHETQGAEVEIQLQQVRDSNPGLIAGVLHAGEKQADP